MKVSGKVLVIDDSEVYRHYAKLCGATAVRQLSDATKCLATADEPYDLVLLDVNLGHVTSDESHRLLLEAAWNVKTVLVSEANHPKLNGVVCKSDIEWENQNA